MRLRHPAGFTSVAVVAAALAPCRVRSFREPGLGGETLRIWILERG